MHGHSVEVAVGVQQDVVVLKAKRANDDIDRLANRHPTFAQQPIISRRASRELLVQHPHNRKATQPLLKLVRARIIPRALKNFEEHDIADQNFIWIVKRS